MIKALRFLLTSSLLRAAAKVSMIWAWEQGLWNLVHRAHLLPLTNEGPLSLQQRVRSRRRASILKELGLQRGTSRMGSWGMHVCLRLSHPTPHWEP